MMTPRPEKLGRCRIGGCCLIRLATSLICGAQEHLTREKRLNGSAGRGQQQEMVI